MAKRPAPAPPPAHRDVAISDIETPYEGFLRVEMVHFRHRLFSGEWSGEREYEVLRRGAAAAVILYDPVVDSIVLVEQFRLPALLAGSSPWQIETAAGLIDSDESPEEVARREVAEETGLEPIGELVPIQRYLPSAGGSDESVYLFCGRIDSSKAGGIHGLADEHEDIRVIVRTMTEIGALLDEGRIESGHTLVAICWLIRHRDELRRRWRAQ